MNALEQNAYMAAMGSLPFLVIAGLCWLRGYKRAGLIALIPTGILAGMGGTYLLVDIVRTLVEAL